MSTEPLTPEQKRILIAEACGWENQHPRLGLWHHKDKCEDGVCVFEDDLPDYFGDLNAMHEAEKILRQNQFHYVHYSRSLFKVVTGKKWDGDVGYFSFDWVGATAAQRAEAFGLTLNLWKP